MKTIYSTKKEKVDKSSDPNKSFLSEFCSQSPFLVINTGCGIGKYKFNKVGYDNSNELILEYKLIDDDRYEDTHIIKHYIGNCYYLSATQVLYAFNYIADS